MPKAEKQQMGFMLPKEAAEWLRDTEQNTGANLSRIVLAALCSYVLRHDEGQRDMMRWAMEVESGNVEFLALRVERWERHVKMMKHLLANAGPKANKDVLEAQVKAAEQALFAAKSPLSGFYQEEADVEGWFQAKKK